MERVLRRHRDGWQARAGEARVVAGDFADEELLQWIGSIAEQQDQWVVQRQQRVIEPTQVLVDDLELDAVSTLDAILETYATDRSAERRRDGGSVDSYL